MYAGPQVEGKVGRRLGIEEGDDVLSSSARVGGRRSRWLRPQSMAMAMVATTLAAGALVALPSVASGDLPDERQYEQVTPADKAGLAAVGWRYGLDGDHVVFSTRSVLGDGDSNTGGGTFYRASRQDDDTGWTSTSLSPRDQDVPLLAKFLPLDVSSALDRSLWISSTPEEAAAGRTQAAYYFAGPGGDAWRASPTISSFSAARADLGGWRGASEDFSTQVFYTTQRPDPAHDTTRDGQRSLYEVVGAGGPNPILRLLGTDGTGAPIGSGCERSLGGLTLTGSTSAFHAVAQGGDTTSVFYTANPAAPPTACSTSGITNPRQVYVRRESRTAPYAFTDTLISPTQCTRLAGDLGGVCYAGAAATGHAVFEGASRDGHIAYMTTSRQLVNGDRDTGRDIYAYDFSQTGQELLPITPTGTATPADVKGIVRISDDGSRIYFVAGGVLTPDAGAEGPSGGPQTATLGANNLYVYERDASGPGGHVTFIARLDAGDSGLWQAADKRSAVAAGDVDNGANGRFLVFSATTKLASGDTDALSDVYRYDSDTGARGTLTRIWVDDPAHNGASRANATESITFLDWGQTATPSGVASDRPAPDGADFVVFVTKEKLVEEDVNDAVDVYQWRDGVVHLISDGHDVSRPGAAAPSVSPSGRDIFFRTAEPLVTQDADTLQDVYTARVGGGIKPPDQKPVCDPDAAIKPPACQNDPLAPPVVTVAGTSDGVGNNAEVVPSFSVTPVSTKQREAAAKSGVITLPVATNGPGQVEAVLRGTVAKRLEVVARRTQNRTGAGSATLRLTLSSASRRSLRDAGKLALTLDVTYSRVAPVYQAKFTLKPAKKAKKTKRKAAKRTTKKAPVKHGKRGNR